MESLTSATWLIIDVILLLLYVAFLVYTIIRILLDTSSSSKALAYLLLVMLLPLFGCIFYFAFGINYRHRKIKNRAVETQSKFLDQFKAHVPDETESILESKPGLLSGETSLVRFIYNLGYEPISKNQFQLLVNGEEKFPDVLKSLEQAKVFIHMEYYAWENDVRGNQIKEVLLKKAANGVTVRVLYDAYASKGIRKNIVRELERGGVAIHPVIPVRLKYLANRLNHRDHRKIIIVDGHTGYLGGINVSDRYDNSIDTGLYWRDTHVRITGPAVLNLQRHFMVNWFAVQNLPVRFDPSLFPDRFPGGEGHSGFAQIVPGGPVYSFSNIMLSYFKLFTRAKEKLYITNPYFIPSDSIMDALKQAALAGVDVRLLLPYKSDSALVGAASRFYFRPLLQAGVRIFLYQKGFVHAKTVVADARLSVVGTANMDIRSFDLNFEIMPLIYSESFGAQLEQVFLKDLTECVELNYEEWQQTSRAKQLLFSIARLISSFL